MPHSLEPFVEPARDFVESCLLVSPQNRFSHLFKRKNFESCDALTQSLVDSIRQFASDMERWQWSPDCPRSLFERLLLFPNLQSVFFYRLSHALFVRQVCFLPDLISVLSRWMTGVEIYYSANIGPGFRIIHGLGTVIGAQCRIGGNFTTYQGVTVGDKIGEQTGMDKRPEIDDFVIACAGSAILGPVHVGAKTIIAANSIVLDSLPGRCIAAGSPAEVKVQGLSDEQFQLYWDSFRFSTSFKRLRPPSKNDGLSSDPSIQ